MVQRSWLVGLVALIAYAVIAPREIVGADNAEFATLGAFGGGAHPPGYPLYILWLRAWSWLPGATPAHTAALATAILGGLMIGVLHAACRAWGARPAAAAIAVAVVGASPIVIAYASQAEVFAMNGLVAALVVWLAAAAGPLRGSWRGGALGLVAGLGLANHLTCGLIAPIGVLGVVRAACESRWTAYPLAVAGFAIGLLPYGYLFIADGPASWGHVTTLSALIDTVSRREYGGLQLMAGGTDVPWITSVAALAATMARSWLWGFAVAGVVMLAVRIARPAGESRWGWAMFTASWLLVGPVLVSQFNIDPHGTGLFICQRFHILPTLLLAIPVAAAIDALIGSRAVLGYSIALFAFVILLLTDLPKLSRNESPALERGVLNMLRSLPPNAIAVIVSEDQGFGGRYLQLACGERPDVWLISSELMNRDWYLARLARQGLKLSPNVGVPLGEALIRTGRPVFVDRGLGALLTGFASYPYGVMYRVLPHGEAPPTAAEIAVLNRDLFSHFDLDYPRPGRDDDLAAVAHRRYAAAWAAIADLLAAAGDEAGARDAVDVARSLQPRQD